MNSLTVQYVLSFSYPQLRELSTPETSACLQWERFFKVQMILFCFYTSTRPSSAALKFGYSGPCDKIQVCTCGLSHTVLSESVTTHLQLWPVEKGSEWGMTRRLTSISLDDMSHSDSKDLERYFWIYLLTSTTSILGNYLWKKNIFLT